MDKPNTIFTGAEGATDIESSSVGSREFVSGETAGLKAIPLSTDQIQEYVDGTLSNFGLLLKMDVETGFLKTFDSSDSTTAANRPRLVIEYTVPQDEPDWVNKSYSYADSSHKHAVTNLTLTDEYNNQTVNTYRYDDNGNMTCRVEGGETFLQTYNAENRMSGVALVSGDCDTPGEISKVWQFTYDGDGSRVKQVYTEGSSTLTTYYYMGGSYEVQTDGTTETSKQYYGISGMTMAMRSDSTWTYFLTDHFPSSRVLREAR